MSEPPSAPSSPSEPVAFNIGLFGHVDSGKTAIARVLTEIVSTAGLDAHPQSKRRGITIDLGFTFFHLKNYLLTLVDAPGHADLIQSVVSAARIIDAAIVVVDGKQGPQIQTGEHLVILESLGINRVIFALNKIDLLSETQMKMRQTELRNLISDTSFPNSPIIPVSAMERTGFESLREAIEGLLFLPQRDNIAPFVLPIDHHFPIKGQGTVVTGTVLSGQLQVGQSLRIVPLQESVRVKSIQVAKQTRQIVTAGNRAGIALTGISPDRLKRGYYLISDLEGAGMEEIQVIVADCEISHFFTKKIGFGTQVHATLGMTTVPGLLYPVRIKNGKLERIKVIEPKLDPNFSAVLLLQEPVFVNKRDPILLARLDLPPTSLRIIGKALVSNPLPQVPKFVRVKMKRGIVKNPNHPQGIVVEQAFHSKEGAHKYLGARVSSPAGKIKATFGTKGDVIVELDNKEVASTIQPGDPVELQLPWEFKVSLPDWNLPA